MWDPKKSEDEKTPWSTRDDANPSTSAPVVDPTVEVASPAPAPPAPPSAPPVDATTPAPVARPMPAAVVSPPTPPSDAPQPPAAPQSPVAPQRVAPMMQPPSAPARPVAPTPPPFSSIGSVPVAESAPAVVPPTPAPAAPMASASSPSALLPATGASALGASQVDAPKRRRWPLLLLALLTVLGSGALSWAVATQVNNNNTTEVGTEIAQGSSNDSNATAQPAMEDTSEPTAPSTTSAAVSVLGEEPFADAAEIIRPSVVQLNLGQGLGTGIIIDTNGNILTAAHVVGNETAVGVTFADGSSVEGVVVGTDDFTDVAVVRIDPAGRDLVPATLANGEDVRVGQIAVAVGSPFGFDQTVTAGIISAIDRVIPNSSASFVQTDAPINPGNSGGPLINLQGEVVGINDLIFTESGSSAGVGFAISIDLAVIIAEQLIDGVEQPQLARLGVQTADPANGDRGAQVTDVLPGTAAEAAGVQVGDTIISLDGIDIRGTGDLRAQVIDQEPGSDITISAFRDGEQVDIPATLGSTNTG